MKYEQLTGRLITNDGILLGVGYAGHGEGRNNPDMEQVHNIGPLPKGRYYIGKPYDSPHTGQFTLPLTPDPSNEMYGRSDFKMHGNNPEDDASEGCIIQARTIREIVNKSIDKIIDVI